MKKEARIFVAGHKGMVGRAIVRQLRHAGYPSLILQTRKALDLCKQSEVDAFFEKEQPEYVFLAAAKVGGILANDSYPAEFIYRNLAIQTHVIDAAYRSGVRKLLFLGSSCIYPKHAPQPMKETDLLSGTLEPTNEAYAVAKIAGIKMCQAYNRQYATRFMSAMPTNLYGPHDNFDLNSSHVLPAMIRKFHEAKIGGASSVVLWGTGTPRREFLHVDDLAEACLFLMQNDAGGEIVNVGAGEDITIKGLAEKVKEIVGYQGEIQWDTGKPDGTPRKLLEVSRLKQLGWTRRITLEDGLKKTYAWFCEHLQENSLCERP